MSVFYKKFPIKISNIFVSLAAKCEKPNGFAVLFVAIYSLTYNIQEAPLLRALRTNPIRCLLR